MFLNAGDGSDSGKVEMDDAMRDLLARHMAPTIDWTDVKDGEHFVQFYQADSFIVQSVADYIFHGLRTEGCCIVLATREHLLQIEERLIQLGYVFDAAITNEHYIALDADETIEKILVDGAPDPVLFAEVIGTVVAKAAGSGRALRVFGELVGVLSQQQNHRAAAIVEEMWGRLRDKFDFSLFCAYPMIGYRKNAAEDHITNICSAHSRVIPDETYTSLSTTEERLRMIASLQQKVKQFENELRTYKL